MKRFLGDMFIGWILFTKSGKKAVNNVFNLATKSIKENMLNSNEFKELINLKNIILGEDDEKSDEAVKEQESDYGAED
jgi:hypothetical protein